MQNISVLMSPRSPSGFTDIKKPNVLHHPMQAKNLHFNPSYFLIQNRNLSYDVASASVVTPCNKIDKPLGVYGFTGNAMTSITTLRT